MAEILPREAGEALAPPAQRLGQVKAVSCGSEGRRGIRDSLPQDNSVSPKDSP